MYDCLVTAPHTQLALAVRARIDGDVVGALGLGGDKGDAGKQVGEVVHRLPHFDSQIWAKYLKTNPKVNGNLLSGKVFQNVYSTIALGHSRSGSATIE